MLINPLGGRSYFIVLLTLGLALWFAQANEMWAKVIWLLMEEDLGTADQFPHILVSKEEKIPSSWVSEWRW